MKYLAFAFDDANGTMEIVFIKNARNVTEARLELKKLIAESSNPALRPGDTVYGVNANETIDAICSVSLKDAQLRASVFHNKRKLAS